MSTLYYGSLDVTKLMEELRKKHSGFIKGNNGKIYLNIKIWRNDEPDRYGNLLSIMMSSKKEKVDSEGKIYLGNCKESEYEGPKPVTDSDLDEINSQLNDDAFNSPLTGGVPRQGENGYDEEIPF